MAVFKIKISSLKQAGGSAVAFDMLIVLAGSGNLPSARPDAKLAARDIDDRAG
ncbi:hypothetical protein [Mesorhizobium sp. CN2-181]|uniref:hypothetical protein n=1 Tax=Mesorhizobium yinganensis TaxID=3157707 RepID=UPI0032B75531